MKLKIGKVCPLYHLDPIHPVPCDPRVVHLLILVYFSVSESCEESDTISTSSSAATIPYNAIGRQKHQQQQQQQHLQLQQNKAFHSKESLLPPSRILQSQCGLRENLSGSGGNTSGSAGVGSGGPASSAAIVSEDTTPSTPSSCASSCSRTVSGSESVVVNAVDRPTVTLCTDISESSSSMSSTPATIAKCFSAKLNCCSRASVSVARTFINYLLAFRYSCSSSSSDAAASAFLQFP